MTKRTIAVECAVKERAATLAFMQQPGARIVSREPHKEASAIVTVLRSDEGELRIIRMINDIVDPGDFRKSNDGNAHAVSDDEWLQFSSQKSGMPEDDFPYPEFCEGCGLLPSDCRCDK